MKSIWEDKAFRHQWVSLRGILQRGGLLAERSSLEQFGELPEETCRRCDEASATWRAAEEDLRRFLEGCVEQGHLQAVPDEAESSDAVAALCGVDLGLADELIERLDARDRSRDAFALAKEALLAVVLSRQSPEHLAWALAHEAGVIPGEVGEAAHLDVPARCLLLALAHVAPTRRHLLSWVLQAVTWPQSSHRCVVARQVGGMEQFTRLRLVENVLVPAGSDKGRPLPVRALCTLTILAISPVDQLTFRQHASKLRVHELLEESGQEALGELARELWLRWGAFTHKSRGEDFPEWLPAAFERVKFAVQALGPVAPPSEETDETPADRRHEPRVHGLNLVNVGSFNAVGLLTDLETGRTLDLSHDGMRLEIHHPISVHSEVGLSLALGEALVTISAEVRSLEVLDEGLYALGLQFLYLGEGGKDAIDAYLERRAAGA